MCLQLAISSVDAPIQAICDAKANTPQESTRRVFERSSSGANNMRVHRLLFWKFSTFSGFPRLSNVKVRAEHTTSNEVGLPDVQSLQ